MKKYDFYFGTIIVILGLLPIVLVRDMSVIYSNFTEIVGLLGGLMSVAVITVLLGMDERCLSVTKTLDTVTKKEFYTVPMLCVIFLVEMVLFYLINPSFVKTNFGIFTGALGGIVSAYVIYALLANEYALVKTSEVKEKVNKKVKEVE